MLKAAHKRQGQREKHTVHEPTRLLRLHRFQLPYFVVLPGILAQFFHRSIYGTSSAVQCHTYIFLNDSTSGALSRTYFCFVITFEMPPVPKLAWTGKANFPK